jgi:putative exosortase-associated protein (TIGR04073 family)
VDKNSARLGKALYKVRDLTNLMVTVHKFMRKNMYLLGSLALVALLGFGCAGPEQKMGRGLSNTTEFARGGEFERSAEQDGIFPGQDGGVLTGFVHGFDRSVARTGLGIYEVVTFPLPPYGPIWTDYLSPRPQYPDSYHPSKWSDAIFDTDHGMGFSGGNVAPWFPGSRFSVFEN